MDMNLQALRSAALSVGSKDPSMRRFVELMAKGCPPYCAAYVALGWNPLIYSAGNVPVPRGRLLKVGIGLLVLSLLLLMSLA